MKYSKEALDLPQQIKELKRRGLIVDDEEKTLRLLGVVSFFRLECYFQPMEADKQSRYFKENQHFDNAVALYFFDKKLRTLVFEAIQSIEIAVRTKVSHYFSLKYGPFWFMEEHLAADGKKFRDNLNSLESEVGRSKEDFILAHYKKYDEPALPPSWKVLEVATFGILSKLYVNMVDNKLKKQVAREFNLSYLDFSSWLTSLAVLRNCCAHHTRIWNRIFTIKPTLPKHLNGAWLNSFHGPDNKLYPHLCVIRYLLNQIYPGNTFEDDLKTLLQNNPNVDVRAMGFPLDWKTQPLWQ